MAVILRTTIDAQKIVDDIRQKIDNQEIDTWIYDEDGDFTHSAEQWKNKAWMSPNLTDAYPYDLTFGILGRRGVNLTMTEYSLYHGRFIELLLKYYSKYIKNFSVTTPKESPYDTSNVDY